MKNKYDLIIKPISGMYVAFIKYGQQDVWQSIPDISKAKVVKEAAEVLQQLANQYLNSKSRKTLRPLRDFPIYSKPIAKAIFDQMDEMIYAPLIAFLSAKEKLNAKGNALVDSLRRGILEYRDGYFVGYLNAAISRELKIIGATWNGTRKVFYLEIAKMPQEVLQAIATGNQSSQEVLKNIKAALYVMEGRDFRAPPIEKFFGDILEKLGKQFHTTTKAVTNVDLEIPFNPKYTEELKEDYTLNLDKYIKGWHDEAIIRLRSKVEENAQEGFRASNLVDIIKSERGVSQRKAEFLARQETGLLTAAYREIRYKDIGVTQYVWSTSHDERVRPDHRILNGKIFSFDHPPVTDQKTGARNNPGEDYGCRCVSVPYLSSGINFIEAQKESINA